MKLVHNDGLKFWPQIHAILIQKSSISLIFVCQQLDDGGGERLLGHERLFEWIQYILNFRVEWTWRCRVTFMYMYLQYFPHTFQEKEFARLTNGSLPSSKWETGGWQGMVYVLGPRFRELTSYWQGSRKAKEHSRTFQCSFYIVWMSQIDWLTGWLAGWLAGWLTDWLTDWLIDWLID